MASAAKIEEEFITATDKVNEILVSDLSIQDKIFEASILVRTLDEHYAYLKDYERKLKELKQLGNQSKGLIKDYITTWMTDLQEKILTGDGIRVTLRTYRDRVVVDNEDMLDPKYKKTKTTLKNSVDKEALKKDLKNGSDIPEEVAHLEDQVSVAIS